MTDDHYLLALHYIKFTSPSLLYFTTTSTILSLPLCTISASLRLLQLFLPLLFLDTVPPLPMQVCDGLNAIPTTTVEKIDCSRWLSPQQLHQIVIGELEGNSIMIWKPKKFHNLFAQQRCAVFKIFQV